MAYLQNGCTMIAIASAAPGFVNDPLGSQSAFVQP